MVSSAFGPRTTFSPVQAEFYKEAEALPVWQATALFISSLVISMY